MLAFVYTLCFAVIYLVQETLHEFDLQDPQLSFRSHLKGTLNHIPMTMEKGDLSLFEDLPWIKTLPEDVQEAATSISSHLPDFFPKTSKKKSTRSFDAPSSSSSEIQADDHSVLDLSPLQKFAELLSEPPAEEVEGDWSIVTGTFTHYDNKNWKNFLRESGAPYLYRVVAANTYETATVSRIFTNDEDEETVGSEGPENKSRNLIKDSKSDKENHKKTKGLSKDFEVLIHASTWFLEHDTRFRLGETFDEFDPDKTKSKTLFYFITPYHLVQNKIKTKFRLLNIWHFWENGFNMTIIDKDRQTTAQKFFKRIK